MRFGPLPLDAAEGAILAHSVALPGGRLRKGQVLGADHISKLRAAGHDPVIAARPDPGDVDENTAAARLASALVPDDRTGLAVDAAFTGRANIRATGPGLIALSPDAIAALNAVDPMITLATLPQWQRVETGMMVATVKIISYAVNARALEAAMAHATGAMRRAAPVLRDADLVVTEVPGSPDRSDKGITAVWDRVTRLGLAAGETLHVPHDEDALADALGRCRADLVLVLTGSATSDIADVAPAALVQAGGQVTRFGMPVDPGNLLVLGRLGPRPVIGLPGCARSPALNGADWVLERIACGIPVSSGDIAAMGVGGLLKEIPTRPQPRAKPLSGQAASLSRPAR